MVGRHPLTFALALALVLLNVLLIWFRKIPFTCSYFPGKMSMAAMALVFILGFVFYVTIMSRLEARWMHEPAGLIGILHRGDRGAGRLALAGRT